MPKRKNRRLQPPFPLERGALAEWANLQTDLPGGTFRGVLTSAHEVWRAGLAAEWQAQYLSRRGLPDELVTQLQEFRRSVGLDPLPGRA